MKLTNNALLMRATSAAIEYTCERGEQRANYGKTIACDTIGRSIGAMARIPHIKSDTPSHQHERNKYAQRLSQAWRKVQPGVACFFICFIELVIGSHAFSHPERSKRTLSHIIMASRLNPTGQGAIHA